MFVSQWLAARRVGSAGGDRARFRHAVLCLFARRPRCGAEPVPRRLRRARRAGLLRGEGQFQPRHPQSVRRLGAGFDIVSGGELARVIAAGGDPGKVVFSGVGKSAAEMRYALERGILCFNVESAGELARLAESPRERAGARRSRCASIRTSMPGPTRTFPPA